MWGNRIAASIAMIAMTQTISTRVNPASAFRPLVIARRRDIGRRPGPAFLPVGAVGDDFIGAALRRRTVDIGLAPGIVRQAAALEIRPVPSRQAAGGLHQRDQPVGGGGIASGIEEKQIERARKALDLDPRRLDLRLG